VGVGTGTLEVITSTVESRRGQVMHFVGTRLSLSFPPLSTPYLLLWPFTMVFGKARRILPEAKLFQPLDGSVGHRIFPRFLSGHSLPTKWLIHFSAEKHSNIDA
jgi:hypothetical protein